MAVAASPESGESALWAKRMGLLRKVILTPSIIVVWILGLLLAQDGMREGQSIIPVEFLLDATDAGRQPAAFRPRVATPYMGYGYQTWLLPFKTRTFAMQGIHGQNILVQPASGIVVVQTSVNEQPSGRQDPRPYQLRDAFWRGVLQSLGGSVD